MVNAVFMGSPPIALPSLHALAAHPQVRLAGVLSQPDRPVGRRRTPQPSAVKAAAQELGAPVLTPQSARDPGVLEVLRGWETELVVVCAYGQILPEPLLRLPRLDSYNLHFSLLPRWRGASPVQAAILAGDATTGVTLQRMVKELDAGEIVATSAAEPIAPDDTAGSLGERLAAVSARVLTDALPALLAGGPPLTPQPAEGVTFCRTIRKADGAVDFAAAEPAEIERRVRAYTPWPGCFCFLRGRRLGLVGVTVEAGTAEAGAPPGTLLAGGRVPTRGGVLRLETVKPEGKGTMPAEAWLNGAPEAVGERLTPTPA